MTEAEAIVMAAELLSRGMAAVVIGHTLLMVFVILMTRGRR